MKRVLLYTIFTIIFVAGIFSLFPKELTYIEAVYENTVTLDETANKNLSNESISMVAFGDMMFDRAVRTRMLNGTNPFLYLKKIEGSTTPDILIANLEGPIIETDRSNCQQKAYSFQFPDSIATRLLNEGFNFLNLANNHSYDCLENGFSNTQKILATTGINYFGGGKNINQSYTVKEIKGKKIAFVGIDMTVHAISIEQFYPLIIKLKKENDLVIVEIHWGEEYNLSYTTTQENVGHSLIDAGADFVIGHHPHVIEPIEIYKNKPIFYSLGNFIFDQEGVEENQGLAVQFSIASSTHIHLLPFTIERSVPTLMSESQRKEFCATHFSQAPECEFIVK